MSLFKSLGTLKVESIQRMETINQDLVGQEHPITNVPFVKKAIVLPNGDIQIGVFPEFESYYDVRLPVSIYLQNDDVQFTYANHELYAAIDKDPSLANRLGLSSHDINKLVNGEIPDGFTWHQNEEPGKLQLVEEDIHQSTGHTDGREIWGGGSEYR
jgi:hypothetical protein